MNLHAFINMYDNVDIFYISCNSITWILPFFEKNYDRFLFVILTRKLESKKHLLNIAVWELPIIGESRWDFMVKLRRRYFSMQKLIVNMENKFLYERLNFFEVIYIY